MADRKPEAMPVETWIDLQIRQASPTDLAAIAVEPWIERWRAARGR